jgi:hypothetical protein
MPASTHFQWWKERGCHSATAVSWLYNGLNDWKRDLKWHSTQAQLATMEP